MTDRSPRRALLGRAAGVAALGLPVGGMAPRPRPPSGRSASSTSPPSAASQLPPVPRWRPRPRRGLKLTWNADAICTVGVPVAATQGIFERQPGRGARQLRRLRYAKHPTATGLHPVATPPARVAALHPALAGALADPGAHARLTDLGFAVEAAAPKPSAPAPPPRPPGSPAWSRPPASAMQAAEAPACWWPSGAGGRRALPRAGGAHGPPLGLAALIPGGTRRLERGRASAPRRKVAARRTERRSGSPPMRTAPIIPTGATFRCRCGRGCISRPPQRGRGRSASPCRPAKGRSRPVIANPNLAEHLRLGASLDEAPKESC
jgi:hypothetical protein